MMAFHHLLGVLLLLTTTTIRAFLINTKPSSATSATTVTFASRGSSGDPSLDRREVITKLLTGGVASWLLVSTPGGPVEAALVGEGGVNLENVV